MTDSVSNTAFGVVVTLQTLLHLGTAGAKLSGHPKVVENFTELGVPVQRVPLLAAAQIAGVAGTLLGLRVTVLGVAASVAFVPYMVGAVVTVWRAQHRVDPPAIIGLSLALAATVLFAQRLEGR